jgi:uncharacterized protein
MHKAHLPDAARRKRNNSGHMLLDWSFYLLAASAVILVGLSKGGFSGLSALAMPLLSLAVSPVRAAAIMLPILIVQDWVSVWAFRRDFDARNLIIMIPASVIGIGAGWLLAAHVSEAHGGGRSGPDASHRRTPSRTAVLWLAADDV